VLDGEGQPCVISQELSSEPNGDEIANCCKQTSLTMSPCVKHFTSTRQHALGEERHFALLEKSAESNQGPAFNQLQVSELSPTHASLRSKVRS
jgi:hypothetical protein